MIEKRAYLHLFEESFPGINANIARWETLGFSWEHSRLFLKEEKGEILSHVGCLEYPMLIEGRLCKVCALHAICTKAAHRNQGLASGLIQDALKWAKERYEFAILFTGIPQFYEKLSFHCIQEYRFHLPCRHPKGSQPLLPLFYPKDNALIIRSFQERAAVSNHVWMKDNGYIASFNALFATYPTYWSLYYSPSINGIISYLVKDKTLHLFDIIASKIPSLDLILDHLPTEIDEIYFYFSPDLLTSAAVPEPYLYDNGYLMAHGNWPNVKPFMISPLSRC
jgi:GNAT superfamily N-acetyltransferase